ncbi:MAG: hypothetical protein QXD19_07575 [Candidatus Bathyarchaeia archaeon]
MSILLSAAEYQYHITGGSDKVNVKIRYIYRTIGNGNINVDTSSLHTIVGEADPDSFNYRDSDGKSKTNPILIGDKPADFFTYIQNHQGKKFTTFGIKNLSTYLKDNDIYWIEIEAVIKGLVKKKEKLYSLPLEFSNVKKDSVIFQIRVPFALEGIFMHKQTVLKSLIPAPSSVYDELDCKVFQWDLGKREDGEKDRFDITYEIKHTFTPVVKYFVSGFIGAILGALITNLLTFCY